MLPPLRGCSVGPGVLTLEGGPVRRRPFVRRGFMVALFAALAFTVLSSILARSADAQTYMPNSTVYDPNTLVAGTMPTVSFVKDAKNGVICYFIIPSSMFQIPGDLSCVKITLLSTVLP